MTLRLKAHNRLYGHRDHFEAGLLGGLEIFEGKTLANLTRQPKTSLLYTGMSRTSRGIEYISFQVNGTVDILDKENICFKYLLASRRLFEFDEFHLHQPDYPKGYLIRVNEVQDKSPWIKTS